MILEGLDMSLEGLLVLGPQSQHISQQGFHMSLEGFLVLVLHHSMLQSVI